MITISCTKKLFELSHFIEEPITTTPSDEFYRWHANVFRLARKNNMIFMNNETRFCFILFGVKKIHFQNIDEVFTQALIESLRFEKLEEELINKYVAHIDQITFTKTYNRSVLGSMTDMVLMTKLMIEDHLPLSEMNIFPLNKQLNRTPILKLKSYPEQLMKEALRSS